ncbi:cytochrome-c peroxidase [Flaviaesturariibacter aridisoli]|uniref:Cytochrome-c peroxidase n=1 Tax=Flaviaesturariibacter aridisoli TaxID=2545761 RepID=A0A4R4DXH5_9BACT|nr:cytochrome c peroxidase [Flaviaesturariibacter aridisoli]TCZ66408.1 cytochrome-c peroxidase [Flaviaesturariibacter aridisoli]
MRPFRLLTFVVLAVAGAVALLQSCRRSEVVPRRGTVLPFVVPAGFPQPAYDFNASPLIEEAVDLGRRLFYEGALSKDSTVPCSSCHMPTAAFTTFEHDRSHGYNHSHTLRNAPGLANLAWYRVYFQDGQYSDLESVLSRHLTHPAEMGENFPELIARLSADTSYVRRFADAFGEGPVSEARIVGALKQFLLSMVSADSKWDRVQRGTASFAPEEAAGAQVFAAKCATCHSGALFSDFSFHNTGLAADPLLNDRGRMGVTGSAADSLKFRVPSLRNLSLTSFYAHDGRYSAFRLYVRHYRDNLQPSPTLDPLLAGGIALSASEEDNLMRFLFTLTDSGYIHNPRYLP